MLMKMFLPFLKNKLEEWTKNGDYTLREDELVEILNNFFIKNKLDYNIQSENTHTHDKVKFKLTKKQSE